MKKKLVSLLLAASMVMSLAACGAEEAPAASSESAKEEAPAVSEEASAEEPSNFNEEGYPIVNEPITLKVMLCTRDTDTLMEVNEMSSIKALEEKTGIHIEWEVVKETDWGTKTNLMLASGEYPDIIIGKMDAEEYGVGQEILIPVDELTEKYMPIYTQRMGEEESDPTISLIKSNGRKYAIGEMENTGADVNCFHFINQTWLDALGLKTPTTIDELTDVLRAFKTQDPNGNGKADEVPIELALNSHTYYGVNGVLPLFGIPKNFDKWVYLDDNMQVKLAANQEEFRDCMEWLHVLYEEELVDAEFLSQDNSTVDLKLATGGIGFFAAYRLIDKGWDDGVKKDSVIFVPAWTDGREANIEKHMVIASEGAYITATNEHVEESLRWMDATLESETMWSLRYGSQDGIDGEGTGWKYNDEGLIEFMWSQGITTFPCLGVNALSVTSAKYNQECVAQAPKTLERINYSNLYAEEGVKQTYSNSLLKLVGFTGEQNEKNNLIETDLNNAINEAMANFVTNGVTDDSWNAFVKQLDEIGAAEYVQSYQDGIDKLNVE